MGSFRAREWHNDIHVLEWYSRSTYGACRQGTRERSPLPCNAYFLYHTTSSWEHCWENPHFTFFFSINLSVLSYTLPYNHCFSITHKFPYVSFFIISFRTFYNFPWIVISPLTYGFFRCVFYNFQIFEGFLCLIIYFNFLLLWSENSILFKFY